MHAVGGQEGLFIGNMQECQAWVVKMFITVTYKNAHLARNLSIIAFFGQKRISMIVAKVPIVLRLLNRKRSGIATAASKAI